MKIDFSNVKNDWEFEYSKIVVDKNRCKEIIKDNEHIYELGIEQETFIVTQTEAHKSFGKLAKKVQFNGDLNLLKAALVKHVKNENEINERLRKLSPVPIKDGALKGAKLGDILKKTQKKYPLNLKLPRLIEFLTSDEFQYYEEDYDVGFEDNFRVGWLLPGEKPEDKRFLEELHKKYPHAIEVLNTFSHEDEGSKINLFSLNSATRYANNDIAMLFSLAKEKNCPEIEKLIKDAMIFCILRDFS
jgi:hypothetical protein